MIYRIENDSMYAEINSLGAELYALGTKNPLREYLWQGDPAVWDGRSPILFPTIGRLLDDHYRYNGKAYTQPKHGFARMSEFACLSCEGDKAVFALESNDETRANYPFEFVLRIEYSLSEDGLTVDHVVQNKSEGEMYFSLGAHPGFQCELGDWLEFSQPETICTERIDTADAYLIDERFSLLENESKIEITKEIFELDALILSGFRSDTITLKSARHPHEVAFSLGGAPYLGIWAKPGAKYVCIEPWHGVNDCREPKADIGQKRGINRLEKDGEFQFAWMAQLR